MPVGVTVLLSALQKREEFLRAVQEAQAIQSLAPTSDAVYVEGSKNLPASGAMKREMDSGTEGHIEVKCSVTGMHTCTLWPGR